MQKIKGELYGLCNITSCQSDKNVVWFNHSTEKYYCADCAKRLNEDPYNKKDALRLFGHNLCTHVDELHITNLIQPIEEYCGAIPLQSYSASLADLESLKLEQESYIKLDDSVFNNSQPSMKFQILANEYLELNKMMGGTSYRNPIPLDQHPILKEDIYVSDKLRHIPKGLSKKQKAKKNGRK